MLKIIVDAMGGDNSPSVNVKGTVKAVNQIKDLQIVLVGDESKLTQIGRASCRERV